MTSPTLQIEFKLSDEKPKTESRDPASGFWRTITSDIAAGDTRQFAKYYEAFFDLMFDEARRLTRFDENQCLDIVQDSMLKSIQCMRTIGDFNQLANWTRTLVKSVVYDRIRCEIATEKRDHEYSKRNPKSELNDEPTELIENQARLLWIEEQVDLLDPNLQKMFQLRFRLGWTLKRIAKQLGLKTGAVDGRLRREIERIKRNAENYLANENK